MIECILFDLDGTLVNREKSLENFLEAQWTAHSELHKIPCDLYVQKFLELDSNGSVWKDIVYNRIILDFNLPSINPDQLLHEYIHDFSRYALLYPDVRQTLRDIKNKNIRLGIITNGRSDLQSSVIHATNLQELMDVILISETERLKKPDKQIFQRALEKLNVSSENSIFIGDNPKADIEGAHLVGMKTIWFESRYFDPPGKNLCPFILQEYKKLPRLIEAM